ncbi:hypothetical protein [Flavihumibacter fluvii]|uniref:hypothetical protein n=1 Tax=Flavihumibacter fluvii TaxID=2838157 RepID=UPI001BDE2FBA|nr:hypothetical protein [Flavihumibacter fluvii]ULQ53169.1 hypothetical protein KJS93_02405 [Flavihumibacter fluvii]
MEKYRFFFQVLSGISLLPILAIMELEHHPEKNPAAQGHKQEVAVQVAIQGKLN